MSAAAAPAATGNGIRTFDREQEETGVEKKLRDLVDRLNAAFGTRLVSALLYGSAAAGDWHETSSDLNVLCVLTRVTPVELGESEPIFRWWREQGNPPPLLMSAEEVRTSTDCFPMEFADMQAHRRVLTGVDVLDGLDIDRSFYRAQVEHELRAKQLRLRQKAAEQLSKPEPLLKLLVGFGVNVLRAGPSRADSRRATPRTGRNARLSRNWGGC